MRGDKIAPVQLTSIEQESREVLASNDADMKNEIAQNSNAPTIVPKRRKRRKVMIPEEQDTICFQDFELELSDFP